MGVVRTLLLGPRHISSSILSFLTERMDAWCCVEELALTATAIENLSGNKERSLFVDN